MTGPTISDPLQLEDERVPEPVRHVERRIGVHPGWLAVALALGLALGALAATSVRGSDPRPPQNAARWPESPVASAGTGVPGGLAAAGWTPSPLGEQPTPSPSVPAASSSPGPAATPHASAPAAAPATAPSPRPTGGVGSVSGGVRGVATWYRYRPGEAAAGPRLRAMLGPSWRGTRVRVCTPSRCLSVVLTDFMRADRLVDLNRDDFQKLAPLSRGVLTVEVSW